MFTLESWDTCLNARALVHIFALLPFAALAGIAWLRRQWGLLLAGLALLLVIALLRRVARSHGRELNACLAMAGALEWSFGILFVIGSLL